MVSSQEVSTMALALAISFEKNSQELSNDWSWL
jgi:hypothetical protein